MKVTKGPRKNMQRPSRRSQQMDTTEEPTLSEECGKWCVKRSKTQVELSCSIAHSEGIHKKLRKEGAANEKTKSVRTHDLERVNMQPINSSVLHFRPKSLPFNNSIQNCLFKVSLVCKTWLLWFGVILVCWRSGGCVLVMWWWWWCRQDYHDGISLS